MDNSYGLFVGRSIFYKLRSRKGIFLHFQQKRHLQTHRWTGGATKGHTQGRTEPLWAPGKIWCFVHARERCPDTQTGAPRALIGPPRALPGALRVPRGPTGPKQLLKCLNLEGPKRPQKASMGQLTIPEELLRAEMGP